MPDDLDLWDQTPMKGLVVAEVEFRDMVPELETTDGIVFLHHPSTAPPRHFTFAYIDTHARLPIEPQCESDSGAAGR